MTIFVATFYWLQIPVDLAESGSQVDFPYVMSIATWLVRGTGARENHGLCEELITFPDLDGFLNDIRCVPCSQRRR